MLRSTDVTVVVCTRERAKLLRAALTAIQASCPAGVEIVVVDSASTTSETRSVAEECGARYLRSDIKGVSIARNVGLAASTREVVMFTDDDCVVTPGWIQALVAQFTDGVGAVTGRLLDHAAEIGRPPAARRISRTREGLDAGHGAVMAFRRPLAVELGGFDEVLGAGRRFGGAEDLDMFCRVLKSGAALVVEPAAVVRHMFTRDDDEFAALNRGYGRGLGAMSSKWLRFAPGEGLLLTFVMLARGFRRATRHINQRRMRGGALALLGGIVVGFFEAQGEPVDGRRFVDRRPPRPILLPAQTRDRGLQR